MYYDNKKVNNYKLNNTIKILIELYIFFSKSKKGFEFWTFFGHFKNVQFQNLQILFPKKCVCD
jgi:hypothetical protein